MTDDYWVKSWMEEMMHFIDRRIEELEEYSEFMRELERTGKL